MINEQRAVLQQYPISTLTGLDQAWLAWLSCHKAWRCIAGILLSFKLSHRYPGLPDMQSIDA